MANGSDVISAAAGSRWSAATIFLLSRPDHRRPARHEHFVTVDPCQRPQCLLRLRLGSRTDRVRIVAWSRAGGLLGQEHAQNFGVFPALRSRVRDHLRGGVADVWQSQASQQRLELVRQRRRRSERDARTVRSSLGNRN